MAEPGRRRGPPFVTDAKRSVTAATRRARGAVHSVRPHRDPLRLVRFGARQAQAQHAVLQPRRDPLRVDAVRQLDAAGEAAAPPLANTADFDPQMAATIGRQIGAPYFVTGKLQSVDERINKERRVQYTLFLQVIEVETSRVRFQTKSERSKAIVR